MERADWQRLLHEKVAAAKRLYTNCGACERRCNVNRLAGERGICSLGPEAHIYKAYVNMAEEAPLLPSYTIFMSGCSLRCAFCSDREAVLATEVVPPADLRRAACGIEDAISRGAKNINFVGGEPDVNLLAILQLLAHYGEPATVVWNTNAFTTVAAFDILTGIVGVYLADFKYGNDNCARLIAGAESYRAVVQRNLQIAERSCQLLVRHLVLPGHVDCCTGPILRWLYSKLPGATVNIMTTYFPFNAELEQNEATGELGRRLSTAEAARVETLVRELQFPHLLWNGFEAT